MALFVDQKSGDSERYPRKDKLFKRHAARIRRPSAGFCGVWRRSVTDYVNQPWRFKRVRRIQDAGREDSDTLDTFDATDLRNIDPGKHTLCAPFSTDDSAADASASPAADSLN